MEQAADEERVELRDGSAIFIRPIRPDDKDNLRRGLEGLGPESRYRRFFVPVTSLSERDLRYLTEVDHYDHEALIAGAVDDQEPVGVARYVRLPDEPNAAEFALTVVDHWQGRGVATEMLRRLVARARAAGIERCRATALAGNREVIELFRGLGPSTLNHLGGGVVELDIELPDAVTVEGPLREAVRSAAAGDLDVRHPDLPDG